MRRPTRQLREFDIGIIACKGTDLDTAVRALEGRAAEDLMTVQNGLGAEAVVRRRGRGR